MSLTGVRFCDTVITPDNIVNSELLFTTEKTDNDLIIPMSATVIELLVRYDNNIPATSPNTSTKSSKWCALRSSG